MELIELKNVGCIKDINTEIDLGRFVFIYGLNGVGKSTIKGIFTNAFLESGTIPLSFGEKDSICKAKLFNNNIIYKKGKLTQKIKSNIKLHVYDNKYVENSIFINGVVNDNNQKEYYRIFVGEDINEKIALKLNLCNDMRKTISEVKEDIFKFDISCKRIDDFLNSLKSAQEILKTKVDIRYAVDETLKKKVIKNCKNLDSNIVDWLIKGKSLQKNLNRCPYCGQYISENLYDDLISHYTEFVNQSLEVITERKKTIDDYIIKMSQYKDIEIFHNDFDLSNFIDMIISKLNEKRDNLPESIFLKCDEKMKSLVKNFSYFKKFINDCLSFLNDVTIDSIFDIPKVEENYAACLSNRTKNLVERFKTYNLDEEAIENYTKKFFGIAKNNIRIVKGMQDIIYEQNDKISSNLLFINNKLKEYDFKYRLSVDRIDQKNLKTSSSAKLGLKLIPNMCNTVLKDLNKDVIKDILSEGEKAILSWVIFLLDLNQDVKNGKHFIVIDDPISSYDSYRRFHLSNEIKNITKLNVDSNVLLLSHEKSFSNVIERQIEKFNIFNMIDGRLREIDLSNIYESNIKDDILYLQELKSINDYKSLFIFAIRSRNIIEYYYNILCKFKPKSHSIFKQKLNKYFIKLSEFIHFETKEFPLDYISFLNKTIKRLTTIDIKIQLDLQELSLDYKKLFKNIDNPYMARLLINKEILDLLNQNNVKINGDETTGTLLDIANKNKIIDDTYYNKCLSALPFLNVYNHPNDNYGLRRIDCSEIKMDNFYSFLNEKHNVGKC